MIMIDVVCYTIFVSLTLYLMLLGQRFSIIIIALGREFWRLNRFSRMPSNLAATRKHLNHGETIKFLSEIYIKQ